MKDIKFKIIEDNTRKYYDNKLAIYGVCPKGVDWASKYSQETRFIQLLKVMPSSNDKFSLLDFGCGYGALFRFIKKKYPYMRYYGYDISSEMLRKARGLFPEKKCKWLSNITEIKSVDFTIANGTFNVKQEQSSTDWLNYIINNLDLINNFTKKGFSFNILTKYSDKKLKKKYLYYADPSFLFDYCKVNYSKNVALLHDYNLFEFTLIVRKQ